MDFNFLGQNKEPDKKKKGNGGSKFSSSILGALLVFMLITGLYLVISDASKSVPQVAISDLAKSVTTGEVKQIVVEGDKLTITYNDGSIKESKKETETSLTQTLTNYGVEKAALDATQIQIK